MSKKNNRFEKMELDPTDVPKKPSILQKLSFRRKLELGNEAQAEKINSDLKKISDDIDRQAEENERRRAIVRQHEMAKTVERVRKEELMEIELKKQYALERKQKAKDKIWLFSFFVFLFIAALYFGGRQSRHLVIELVIGLVFAFFGYRRRRGWWE